MELKLHAALVPDAEGERRELATKDPDGHAYLLRFPSICSLCVSSGTVVITGDVVTSCCFFICYPGGALSAPLPYH